MKNKIILLILTFTTLTFFSCDNVKYKSTEIEHELKLSSGTVKRFYFESDIIDSRNIDVWLPDGFSEKKKYNVLYMHDGGALYDATGSWNASEWGVDETMAELLKENKIEDMIVVGIWNNGHKRHTEYFPQKAIDYIAEPQRSGLLELMAEGPIADDYLKFIVTELKHFIDKTFPTYTDREHTFICGSSMGGLISIYALCEYPDIFSGAACMSTHWIGGFEYNKEIPKAINQYLEENLPLPGKHKLYFDYGTVGLDANYPEFQKLVNKTIQAKNYESENWMSLEFEGDDHNEKYWAARLDKPFCFLLGKAK